MGGWVGVCVCARVCVCAYVCVCVFVFRVSGLGGSVSSRAVLLCCTGPQPVHGGCGPLDRNRNILA